MHVLVMLYARPFTRRILAFHPFSKMRSRPGLAFTGCVFQTRPGSRGTEPCTLQCLVPDPAAAPGQTSSKFSKEVSPRLRTGDVYTVIASTIPEAQLNVLSVTTACTPFRLRGYPKSKEKNEQRRPNSQSLDRSSQSL